ncbi:tripartite motif-containing protein 2-like [Saccostrea echinata]|uniref:tripartite motif-containing protein 2-like n=1 Tax=Saccostrea echinata TaxID=191078 RepID=UPI002A8012B2|nr:tripartite motif-containing protein 2-like [Saccostrea echinata]
MLKLLPEVVLEKSIPVPGIKYSSHITILSSDRLWVSDDFSKLVLADQSGTLLHTISDVSNKGHGIHTVTSSGDLLYLDIGNNICRLSSDGKSKTVLFSIKEPLTPWCIYNSPSNGDLLVGMKTAGTLNSKVSRFNSAGKELTVFKQQDSKNKPLFGIPHYITENKNGDVIISDIKTAIVAMTRDGDFRFSYRGPPFRYRRLLARAVCTDALSNIIVNCATTGSVQIIDKDGKFLALLLEPAETGLNLIPYGLAYDTENNLLIIGSQSGNNLSVYKHLQK